MAIEYRLLTFSHSASPAKAGILVEDKVYPTATVLKNVSGIADVNSILGLLQNWDIVNPALRELASQLPNGEGTPLGEIDLLAPILYPGALFCAGANYWDHLEEMAAIAQRLTGKAPSMTKAPEPWFFLKTAAHSIIGTSKPIRLPDFSRQVDWEAELGVVIGRSMRNVAEERALEGVAGYVIVNDLSARDLMKREGTPFIYDWLGQKCFEDAAPMGPWLTPADFVQNPDDLEIKLWINDELKQSSNTSKMVHNVREQIAYLSRHFTLRPGDVVATGTPAGVGMPRGEFLKDGDVIKIEIARCGTLVNYVEAG